MRLDQWHDLTTRAGPFATVAFDATRDDPEAAQEVRLRWRSQADALERHGAPAAVIEQLAQVADEPTGRPGKIGRLLVAAADGVALDLVLPRPPVREGAMWGAVPSLMPVVRAFADGTSYLLVTIDTAGADLTVVGAGGDELEREGVDGSHDVLHKVPGGGWAQRRMQSRVEDSVERNADEVALAVTAEVGRFGPDLVLVAGENRSVTRLLEQLPQPVRERTEVLASGSRAAGLDSASTQREVHEVLDRRTRSLRAAAVERFGSASSRQREAVQGLEDVVTALQRGQVDELLLHDDPSTDLTLWVSGDPLQLALRRDDLLAMGVDEDAVGEVRADAAVVWSLLGSGAAITLLEPDDAPLVGGIGAVLRWADASTPHSGVPSMPGHGAAPGA